MESDAPLPPPPVTPLAWEGDAASGTLRILDQTLLPATRVELRRTRWEEVVADVRRLAVRGAPVIGLAGAYALVLAARALAPGATAAAFRERLRAVAETIGGARPTAVNLRAAVASLLDVWERAGAPREGAAARLLEAARALERYETTASEGIARAGADLLGDRTRFLTHCNAGALVTVGLGTALAPVYLLHARGRPVQVWVDETRPLLQGLRLTAFELGEAGIPHRVLVDGAAAGLIARGAVDAVLVGADRICRNGDVLNKVGTYGLALAARAHAVPFVVLAPLSTLDPALPGGSSATVEERPADLGRYLAAEALPRDVETWGPAFDVTPAALVSAWVTERGWTRDPGAAGLGAWMAAAGGLQAGGGTGR